MPPSESEASPARRLQLDEEQHESGADENESNPVHRQTAQSQESEDQQPGAQDSRYPASRYENLQQYQNSAQGYQYEHECRIGQELENPLNGGDLSALDGQALGFESDNTPLH